MADKINIAFKVDSETYLKFKAVIAAYNAEHRTRYNVSNILLAHINDVVQANTIFPKGGEER